MHRGSGGGSGYQSFTLDAIGNISSVTTWVPPSTAPPIPRIRSPKSAAVPSTYDNNGNVTTDDQGHTLIYDAWNRLVAVETADGYLLKAYTYDGLGRMTSETDGTVTTDIYYVGDKDVEERTGVTDATGASLASNGTLTLQNVWSAANSNILTMRDSFSGGTLSQRLYFSEDADTDVTAAFTTTSIMADQRMAYDSQGNVQYFTWNWFANDNVNNLETLYQSLKFDSAIGWYFSDTRIYSPTMMVWNTRDPSGYPDGMNADAFEADNPINRVDPTGLYSGIFSLQTKMVWDPHAKMSKHGYEVSYKLGVTLPPGHRLVLVQAIAPGWFYNRYPASIDKDMGFEALNKTTLGGIPPVGYLESSGLRGTKPNSFQDGPLETATYWADISIIAIDRSTKDCKSATNTALGPDKILSSINFSLNEKNGDITLTTGEKLSGKGASIIYYGADPSWVWQNALDTWWNERRK